MEFQWTPRLKPASPTISEAKEAASRATRLDDSDVWCVLSCFSL